ncbi:MAG: hypothetical protein ACFFAN_05515, partial [Promethearchaeota archaeon]
MSFSFEIDDINDDSVVFDLDYNQPIVENGDTPVLFAYFYTGQYDKVYIDDLHLNVENYDYDYSELKVTNLSTYGLQEGDTIYVDIAAELHNKFQNFHSFDLDLRTDEITLKNWDVGYGSKSNLIANYESANFIYDVSLTSEKAKGKVKQIYAVLGDNNNLTYYLTDDLDDPDQGWENYDTLVLKMGLLNPDALSHLEVEFYCGSQLIGTTSLYPEAFSDDSGAVYISLPQSNYFDTFTVENNAHILFKPVFYEHSDFKGYYYEQGLPSVQTVEWREELVSNGELELDLDRQIFSDSQSVLVFNKLFEFIYETEVGTRTELIDYYDEHKEYELAFNNVTLPDSYIDDNGNKIVMEEGDILYLKYNASLEKAIGITIDEM